MSKSIKYIFGILIVLINFYGHPVFAQLSPGDLSKAHSHLEGLSNCTQCHILGEKVSNDKCLACHTELKIRIEQQKGYHASTEIAGKECIVCHSDHHGRNFQMIRFDTQQFDHRLTGYELMGAHLKQDCKNCHKTDFITDKEIAKKEYTYLGLDQKCLSCHDDYHQNTMSISCTNCHGFDAFKPALKFDHNDARFKLSGKHKEVECVKCHQLETRNGTTFQVFKGIEFASCNNCHQDIHNNKFGQDCAKCHTEKSFHMIKGLSNFDHNTTAFKLEGQHLYLECSACHKTKYTDPIRHKRCADCHDDYHNNQFVKNESKPDCINCHNNRSFKESNFSIEDHNKSKFQLQGAHLATPCFACHKKEEKWSFRNIGEKCIDCHQDIHQPYMSSKYYPDALCENCHDVNTWNEITTFNHSQTKFKLDGGHLKPGCRACHFKTINNETVQQFAGLSTDCEQCHSDIHAKQFDNNGFTDCTKCHETMNWHASKFDHNAAQFKLDGKHKDVECYKCHKPVNSEQTTYIQYKFKDFKCETCH